MRHTSVQALMLAATLTGLFGGGLLARAEPEPAAVLPDGGRYYGSLLNGRLHGHGRLEWDSGGRYLGGFADGRFSGHGQLVHPDEFVYEGEFSDGQMSGRGSFSQDGNRYRGEFRHNRFWGEGELTSEDGNRYAGAFERGRFHGLGRYEMADGRVYEGRFEKGLPVEGSYSDSQGTRYSGGFRNWRFHGPGEYTTAGGETYSGEFEDGLLIGAGRATGADGQVYEGPFRHGRYHGHGSLTLPNGDRYVGEFRNGLYHGQGTLSYAEPVDGRTQDSGHWKYGELFDPEARDQALRSLERAIYGQGRLLEEALAAVQAGDPGRIELYLLAVAGDGSQEVFRREVDFVRDQFDRDFGTAGRSLALINSRNTLETAPMATATSLDAALKGLASRMDPEQDILFLFLTSHGSQDHRLQLEQNGLDLRGLPAAELATLLKDSGIRWKVVVVSACYSGGFIEPLRDDHTLIITAARHDRTSFGCADENDFTYFGRAFFKEALATTPRFEEAFTHAAALVKEWEAEFDNESLPQIHAPKAVLEHLERWRAQR